MAYHLDLHTYLWRCVHANESIKRHSYSHIHLWRFMAHHLYIGLELSSICETFGCIHKRDDDDHHVYVSDWTKVLEWGHDTLTHHSLKGRERKRERRRGTDGNGGSVAVETPFWTLSKLCNDFPFTPQRGRERSDSFNINMQHTLHWTELHCEPLKIWTQT